MSRVSSKESKKVESKMRTIKEIMGFQITVTHTHIQVQLGTAMTTHTHDPDPDFCLVTIIAPHVNKVDRLGGVRITVLR